MYAVVDIAGQQFKVTPEQEIYVHRLPEDVGADVEFKKILLYSDDKGVKVDKLGGASVKATVVEHLKGDKVIVFKKKRRKGYKVKRGHRQYLTKIRVNEIFV